MPCKGNIISTGQRPVIWWDEPFQALKGRRQVSFRIAPLQGLNLRMYPFHRATPDANTKRLSALILVISCLFFIPKRSDLAAGKPLVVRWHLCICTILSMIQLLGFQFQYLVLYGRWKSIACLVVPPSYHFQNNFTICTDKNVSWPSAYCKSISFLSTHWYNFKL